MATSVIPQLLDTEDMSGPVPTYPTLIRSSFPLYFATTMAAINHAFAALPLAASSVAEQRRAVRATEARAAPAEDSGMAAVGKWPPPLPNEEGVDATASADLLRAARQAASGMQTLTALTRRLDPRPVRARWLLCDTPQPACLTTLPPLPHRRCWLPP